ncbi:MAG: hypothetical protein WCO56_27590 [Verrucomicrobiota bacterium]
MDFVPKTRKLRYPWYKKLAESVDAETSKFGADPADVAVFKEQVQGLVTRLEATDALAAALRGARKAELVEEREALPKLRAVVRHWKTLKGFPASGSEAALGLKGQAAAFAPATYKPVIRVRIAAGRIRIGFAKRGVTGLAFYMRLRGVAEWRKLGVDTRAPFWDDTPLAQPGVPEVREYMARGMINDDEVGVESDIVSVTYGG